MRRVLALEDVERAGCERQGLHAFVMAGQKTGDAFVVRIRVTSEPAAVPKLPARERRLQEDGDGEFGPVEVPVEPLASPIGHDVDPAEGIGHRVEPRLLQRRRQEVDKRLPLVNLRDRAGRNLVAADRVIDGRVSAQRRVTGLKALDLVIEVDVVIPGMGEGSRVEERLDLLDGSPKGLGTDEARETEHAGVAQLAPAAGDQCLPACAVERVHRPAIEIENLLHERHSLGSFAGPLPR